MLISVLFVAFLILGCTVKSVPAPAPVSAVAVSKVVVPEPVAEPEPPPPEDPRETIQKLTSFTEAFQFALPTMDDTMDEDSVGATLLGFWAMKHMRLSDVRVTSSETSYSKVRKDPDAARGKRMCITGMVVQIQLVKTDFGRIFIGLLMSDSMDLYRFLAVRSTGDLVGKSRGRICGVVTGTYDYHNSGGGTGHAVSLVGVFDLPENR